MVLCPQHCASFSGKWHFHSTSWGRILQISQHFCEKLESYKRYFFVSWKDSLYKVIWVFFEYFTMYPCAEEIMRVFLCFLEWNWSLHIIWGKKSHYPVHLALLLYLLTVFISISPWTLSTSFLQYLNISKWKALKNTLYPSAWVKFWAREQMTMCRLP